MKIKILDYANNATTVDVGDIESIQMIIVMVITGDEVLKVLYKDGRIKEFDSSNTRIRDYYDGEYVIYNANSNKNIINKKSWINRYSSYDNGFMEDE